MTGTTRSPWTVSSAKAAVLSAAGGGLPDRGRSAPPAGSFVFTARRAIVINTGTEPMLPPIPGLADVPYWTNREAIAATEVPESLIVVGRGDRRRTGAGVRALRHQGQRR